MQGEVQYTFAVTGPDVQNMLRLSYYNAKVTIDFRRRLIYQTSYEERKAFLWYYSLAKL